MIAAKATKSSNEPMSNAKVSRLSGMNITAKSTAPTSRYSTANPAITSNIRWARKVKPMIRTPYFTDRLTCE